MRCYHVLIHGKLDWRGATPAEDASRPRGFYCHRYVLAADERRAADIAFQRVRSNLARTTDWLDDGGASLLLEAEEITPAPVHKLLKPDNRGHTFYEQE
jgi:hypothetical protein